MGGFCIACMCVDLIRAYTSTTKHSNPNIILQEAREIKERLQTATQTLHSQQVVPQSVRACLT